MQQISFVHAGSISKIRFGQPQPSSYRIVIETNTDSNFKAFMLDNPRRLIVDIPSSVFNAPQFIAQKNIPIKNYHAKNIQKDVTQIVFDLKSSVRINSAFILPTTKKSAQYRIVIDLKNVMQNKYSTYLDTAFNRTIKNGQKATSVPILRTTPPAVLISKEQRITQLVKTFLQNEKAPSNMAELIAIHSTTETNNSSPLIKVTLPARKPIPTNNSYTIAIDAGHGGKDPGAIKGRIREKNITLSLAYSLKKQLEKNPRYKVILTRPADKFVKLRKRVDIARRVGADLFISLHADKIDRKNVRGTSIYTLSEKASDKESAKLARRENEADIIAGVNLSHEDEDVADILIDLAIRDTMNNSNILANTIISNFKASKLRLLKTSHRSAGFAVLKAPDIPSVLIEAGFISNRQEARLLTSPAHQQKIAKAITRSINKYFAKIESTALH